MTVSLPAGPSGARVARQAVKDALDRSGVEVDLDVVLLCASELATNAVLHGSPPIELDVIVSAKAVRVAVSDAGGGTAEQRRPVNLDTAAGRGLRIVDAMATRWGTEQRAQGKTIWFEVAAS